MVVLVTSVAIVRIWEQLSTIQPDCPSLCKTYFLFKAYLMQFTKPQYLTSLSSCQGPQSTSLRLQARMQNICNYCERLPIKMSCPPPLNFLNSLNDIKMCTRSSVPVVYTRMCTCKFKFECLPVHCLAQFFPLFSVRTVCSFVVHVSEDLYWKNTPINNLRFNLILHKSSFLNIIKLFSKFCPS